jgi:hypothetical protein
MDRVLEPGLMTRQYSGTEAPMLEEGFLNLRCAGSKPREIRYQKGPLP